MDDKVRIITNYHDRFFLYRDEVPADTLADYDHLGENESFDGWMKYRGEFYHISDFMAVHNEFYNPNPPNWMIPWDGYLTDSFFSGILIKVSDDMESYRIALYLPTMYKKG